jgi:hypothetical protein
LNLQTTVKQVKAIARAFRWQKLILDSKCNTLLDIAVKEKICPTLVSRVARLSTLSPKVIEAVLEGKHPTSFSMKDLFKPFSSDWAVQEKVFLKGVNEG